MSEQQLYEMGEKLRKKYTEKKARIDLKLNAEVKQIIQYAANLQGRTLSDFVIESAYKSAIQIISKHEEIKSLMAARNKVNSNTIPITILTNSISIQMMMYQDIDISFVDTSQIPDLNTFFHQHYGKTNLLFLTEDLNFVLPHLDTDYSFDVFAKSKPTKQEILEKVRYFKEVINGQAS